MAIKLITPTTSRTDPLRRLLDDEASQRQIRIKLDNQYNQEAKSFWNAKQMQTYPNMMQITPDIPTTASLITNEVQAQVADEQQQYGIAMQNLVKITNVSNAEYIIQHLSPDDIFYMNTYFRDIVSKVMKTASRMSNNVFINFVKRTRTEDKTYNSGRPELEVARIAREANENRQIVGIPQKAKPLKYKPPKYKTPKKKTEYDLNDFGDDSDNDNDGAVSNEGVMDIKQEHQPNNTRDWYNSPATKEEMNQLLVAVGLKKISVKDKKLIMGQKLNDILESSGVLNDKGWSMKLVDMIYTQTDQQIERNCIDAGIEVSLNNKIKNAVKLIEYRLGSPLKGKGFSSMKKIVGRGKTEAIKPDSRKLVSRKYLGNNENIYIDLKKLKTNILVVKYTSSDANIPSLKTQSITNNAKECIESCINDSFNQTLFDGLNPDDKRLVKRFLRITKFNNIDLEDKDDAQFQINYEILLGEFNSGNNSPLVKNQLKKYVLQALAENQIPRNEAMMLIFQLSV